MYRTFALLGLLAALVPVSSFASPPNAYPEAGPAPLNIQELPSNLRNQAELLQGIYKSPYFQKYFHAVTDPKVQDALFKLIEHPNRKQWIYFELGWILFIFIAKAWLMTSTKGFVKLVFMQLWTFALFLAGVVWIVPVLVFGDAYKNFIDVFWAAIQ